MSNDIESNISIVKKIDPKLYLLATPIGNLGDISYRTVETLRAVDAVYCEDTRNTLKLLNHLGIKKPVYSCHEHNEEQRANELCELVKGGKAIAFVSDAGMPAISDPGERLVRVFIEKNVPFEVQPGANAILTALVMSGLSTKKIYFCGFLPRNGSQRSEAIGELRRQNATCIIYESPLRVGSTFCELYEKLGNRQCALVREITKLHEEVIRGSLSELSERYRNDPPKGECVIVIGQSEILINENVEKLQKLIEMLLESGISVRDAAKIAAFALDFPKNEAYRLAVKND